LSLHGEPRHAFAQAGSDNAPGGVTFWTIAFNAQRFAQKPDEVLQEITRKQIQEAIDEMVGLMNRISELFLDHETHYFPAMRGDGESLIHCLQYAERLHELQDVSWYNRLNDQQVIEKLQVRMLGEPI